MTGIKELLQEKYEVESAKEIYTECVKSIYDYAAIHDYNNGMDLP
mgnify:FL=1